MRGESTGWAWRAEDVGGVSVWRGAWEEALEEEAVWSGAHVLSTVSQRSGEGLTVRSGCQGPGSGSACSPVSGAAGDGTLEGCAHVSCPGHPSWPVRCHVSDAVLVSRLGCKTRQRLPSLLGAPSWMLTTPGQQPRGLHAEEARTAREGAAGFMQGPQNTTCVRVAP